MYIYFIELFFVIFLWLFKDFILKVTHKRINGEVIYLALCFFMFGLTMALRKYTVGTDASTYYNMYKRIAESHSYGEALKESTIPSAAVYVGLHYFITRFVYIQQLLFVTNALIISLGFFIFIKKESNNYLLSCILFFALTLFYESMNGTRQFMAIALAVNAFSLIKKNVYSVSGWLLFILAIGIHNTTIFFSISFVGIYLENRKMSFNTITLISLLFSILLPIFFIVGVKIIIKIFPYYEMYVNGGNSAQIFAFEGKGRISILYLSLLLCIFVFVIIAKKNHIRFNLKAYHFSCIFCAVFGIIFSRNILMNRVLWPFLTLFLVYFPNIITQFQRKDNYYLMCLLCVALPYIYSLFHLIEDKSDVVPYLFFWQ